MIKASPSLLIISEEDDAHIPFVSQHLKKEQLVIFDPATIITGNDLSYTITNADIEIVYKGISLKEITSVWYRKPRLPEKMELPVAEAYQKYSYDALKKHTEWFFDRFEKALWVSPYYTLLKASNKLSQLQLAKKLGFLVPDTLQTSNPQAAKEFIKKYSSIIIKPVSAYGFPISNKGKEEHVFFFAMRILQGQSIDLTNLELAPTIFQQAVENVRGDIRVNVVGQKAFPALITNPHLTEHQQVRDWRIGHDTGTIKIEPFNELPKEISDLCIAHVQGQGLNFGAIDLVLDDKGNYWFLENNPNGQWAFVEKETKQPIGEELAYFLLHEKNK